MAKTILYKDTARWTLEKGFDALTEAVAVTLGPKGRRVSPVERTGVTKKG